MTSTAVAVNAPEAFPQPVTARISPPAGRTPANGFPTLRRPAAAHNGDYGAIRQRPDDENAQPRYGPVAAVAAEFLGGHHGNTRSAYAADLRDFCGYCAGHRLDPLEATRADLRGYLAHLQEQGRARSTLARRAVALRGFYSTAVDDFDLPANPAARLQVRRPRDTARVNALTLPELRRLLSAADRSTARSQGLAWLLASTGLRISEACTARIEDITATGEERWLTVTCKGGVRRSVPLHPTCWQRLMPLAAEGAGPLFATAGGNPLDRHSAARNLRRLATAAAIPGPFSPHVLRHTFVTLARQAGCTLEDLQDAAGHADPATTRAYDRTAQTHATHPATRLLSALSATPH